MTTVYNCETGVEGLQCVREIFSWTLLFGNGPSLQHYLDASAFETENTHSALAANLIDGCATASRISSYLDRHCTERRPSSPFLV